MRIEQFLSDSAARLPAKIAVVAESRRLSFADVDRMSDRLAGALVARGLKRGDRVVVFMENCWEAVVSIFAILKAGAVFSPISPSTKADKLALVLSDCRAAGIITQARLAMVTAKAMIDAPLIELVVLAGGAEAPPVKGCLRFEDVIATVTGPMPPLTAGIEIDPAMLIHTFGSTGLPEGVMMTHQDVVAASNSTYLNETEEGVILAGSPISFDCGLHKVLMAMRAGETLVLEKSFALRQTFLSRGRWPTEAGMLDAAE